MSLICNSGSLDNTLRSADERRIGGEERGQSFSLKKDRPRMKEKGIDYAEYLGAAVRHRGHCVGNGVRWIFVSQESWRDHGPYERFPPRFAKGVEPTEAVEL